MQPTQIWNALDTRLIAILRGIRPEQTGAIVTELLEAGIRAIEIPLNSPEPFRSIETAARVAAAHSDIPCLVGAGTVLRPQEVERVEQAGGNLVVSPNADGRVIRETVARGLFSAPGVQTPTECMAALAAGAHCLKVFPANQIGPDGFKALSAVFRRQAELCAVGGVGPGEFQAYLSAGASAFGLGSALYKPGMPADEVGLMARQCVAAFNGCAA